MRPATNKTGEVTALLRAWHAGDEDAYRQLSSILYRELRHEAARRLRGASGNALQTTALVHQTFIRLAAANQVDWQDRGHFLAIAGRTMRRVLVDLFREHGAAKRGARAEHVPLDSGIAAAGVAPVDLIALDRALERLGSLDPRKVQVIELKFFAGLTLEETAEVLNVSRDTIARDWRMARTWLLNEFEDSVSVSGGLSRRLRTSSSTA